MGLYLIASTINMEDFELTLDQEKSVLETWNRTPSNPPSLKALSLAVFGIEYDGRSKEVRAIKTCLAKHNLKARAATTYKPVGEIELSDAHKQYITNNAKTMNALEMAKILFANPALTNLHAEVRAVNDLIKTLDTKVVYDVTNVSDVPKGKYSPPNTMDKVLKYVNQYVSINLDKGKLNAFQRKGLETLIGYLHTYRFIKQMNSFDSEDDRKSCEDAFIRYTYDKPDLTQEEVDQYIILANEVVMAFKAQHRHEHLQRMLDQITGTSPEDAKISMSLVEMIGKAASEFNQCVKRQQDLLDDLKEKRSSRVSKQIKDNASILNLISEWKQEEFRKKYLQIAELEQESVARELEKMEDVENIKARIFGLTRGEILNG
jgi:hypothetical protein